MPYISPEDISNIEPLFEIDTLSFQDREIAAILANTLELNPISNTAAICSLALSCVRYYDGQDARTREDHLSWFKKNAKG